MQATERELFAKALSDAFASRVEEELAGCNEDDACSLSHYRKMSKILGFNVVPEKILSLRKRIAIVVLAAALLLVGCTAIVFGDEIKTLFEKIFDTHVFATYDEEERSNGSVITEFYVPTYVPEGYELISKNVSPIRVIYKFENDSGKALMFEQYLMNGVKHRFDNETGGSQIIQIDDYKIYYRISGLRHSYVWSDYKYTLVLSLDCDLSYDELYRIVSGFIIE